MCVVKVSLCDRRLRVRSPRLLGVAFAKDEHVACGVSTRCQVEVDVAGSAARFLVPRFACRRRCSVLCLLATIRARLLRPDIACGDILGTASSVVQVVRSVAFGRVSDNVSCVTRLLLFNSTLVAGGNSCKLARIKP